MRGTARRAWSATDSCRTAAMRRQPRRRKPAACVRSWVLALKARPGRIVFRTVATQHVAEFLFEFRGVDARKQIRSKCQTAFAPVWRSRGGSGAAALLPSENHFRFGG